MTFYVVFTPRVLLRARRAAAGYSSAVSPVSHNFLLWVNLPNSYAVPGGRGSAHKNLVNLAIYFVHTYFIWPDYIPLDVAADYDISSDAY